MGLSSDRGNGVTPVTAAARRERATRRETAARGERATATWLTGAAGVLLLTAAAMLMVIAAPSTQPAAGPGGQVTLRTESTMVRACRPGPVAVSAWAEAYTPSMITESWSASSSEWSPRPP
jgi:hypothetical protein